MIPKALQPFIIRTQGQFHLVSKQDIPDAIVALVNTGYRRLNTISALDTGSSIELIYHLTGQILVNVKVVLPRERAKVRSITPFVPSAALYEREIAEMLGVEFVGHPDPRHLFLPDNWRGFPLRKETKRFTLHRRRIAKPAAATAAQATVPEEVKENAQ